MFNSLSRLIDKNPFNLVHLGTIQILRNQEEWVLWKILKYGEQQALLKNVRKWWLDKKLQCSLTLSNIFFIDRSFIQTFSQCCHSWQKKPSFCTLRRRLHSGSFFTRKCTLWYILRLNLNNYFRLHVCLSFCLFVPGYHT